MEGKKGRHGIFKDEVQGSGLFGDQSGKLEEEKSRSDRYHWGMRASKSCMAMFTR